jgi:hypothetical protein
VQVVGGSNPLAPTNFQGAENRLNPNHLLVPSLSVFS